MFRPVRKIRNLMSDELARQLLKDERRGVLSMIGDDGYPYAIPVNYLYNEAEGTITFHGSKIGHKVDAIRRCDKVCFTVYGHETVREEAWAPYLRSAVVFGRCRIVEDPEEILRLCKPFAMKYYPTEQSVDDELARSGAAVGMFEITIDHISGKEVQEK